MSEIQLFPTINHIVDQAARLKGKYLPNTKVVLEFVCIFCLSEEEYQQFTREITALANPVQDTETGYTYLMNLPLETNIGSVRLVKIRKPDSARIERGDVDFTTDYSYLKAAFAAHPNFELVMRHDFEMLRLSEPGYDVMVCFSNIPLSQSLGIIA